MDIRVCVWKFFGQYYSYLYHAMLSSTHTPSQFGEPVDMHNAITSVSEWINLIKERLSHTQRASFWPFMAQHRDKCRWHHDLSGLTTWCLARTLKATKF